MLVLVQRYATDCNYNTILINSTSKCTYSVHFIHFKVISLSVRKTLRRYHRYKNKSISVSSVNNPFAIVFIICYIHIPSSTKWNRSKLTWSYTLSTNWKCDRKTGDIHSNYYKMCLCLPCWNQISLPQINHKWPNISLNQ